MQQPIWLPVSYDGGKLQVELCTFNTATFEASFILNEILASDDYFRYGVSIKPGATVVDVGANIGVFGICVLKRDPSIQYIGVEPAPPNFAALKANLLGEGPADGASGSFFDRNEEYVSCKGADYPGNIKLLDVALSSKCATEEIVWYAAVPGNSTFTPDEKEGLQTFMAQMFEAKQKFSVRVFTLDQLLEEADVQGPIDLIKVDVEGLELEVLKGAGIATWKRVRQVVLEVHDCLPGEFDNASSSAPAGTDADKIAKIRAKFAESAASGVSPDVDDIAKDMPTLPGDRVDSGAFDGVTTRFIPLSDSGRPAPPPRVGGRVMQVCDLLKGAGFHVTVACPMGIPINYYVAASKEGWAQEA